MSQKPKRIYHNIKEFELDAEKATKIAMDRTLEKFKEELKRFIQSMVYNVYQPKWYKRTNSLLQDSTLETYIYKNASKSIGGGIRFNPEYYNNHSERDREFHHGNEIRFLEFGSYLEILNDSSKINPNNPYHFPVVQRGHFYDDFLRYVDANFDETFENYFRAAMGIKPNLKGYSNKNKAFNKNLSSSTSNIPSLSTGTLGGAKPNSGFTGTITVTQGNSVSVTKY